MLPAKWDLEPIKDHFAHLDPGKHPGMICFTENDQLGIIDRVTAVTPGRYITRFYETEVKMHVFRAGLFRYIHGMHWLLILILSVG